MPNTVEHVRFMSRCVALARRAGKHVKSNPMVGALLVHKNRIIGESYHKKYGEAHAEVNAINSVASEDSRLIPQSTLYVSLEPCNIVSKTPACTSLILDLGIKRIVIGCADPNPEVNGKGIALLEEHGVEVLNLKDVQCKTLIRPFKHLIESSLPYVILKFAQSSDFYIGAEDQQVWISNEASKIRSHQWRTEVDAILIGSNTILVDNPSLTARLYPGESPERIILDRSSRVDASHNVVADGLGCTIVDSKDSLTQIMQDLRKQGVNQILVEGGKKILKSFIEENIWNEARVITSKTKLNSGIKAPGISGVLIAEENMGTDSIKTIINE